MSANNMEYVIASTADPCRIWNFCTPETAAGIIAEAERDAREGMERAESYAAEYPDNRDYWQYQAEQYRKVIGTYAMMTFDEQQANERAYLLALPLYEISEERFNDMLDALPPLKWCRKNGVEMFCMREFFTDSYTDQYAHDHSTGKYYSKLVDYLDPSTWISEILARSETRGVSESALPTA